MTNKPTDAEIEELALQLRQDKPGLSLVDSMLKAEDQLTRQMAPQENVFHVEIHLKPRIAKFIREQFGGHPELSIEERLAVYLAGLLARTRGEFISQIRDSKADVPNSPNKSADTGPLAMRRSRFLEATK